MADGDVSVGGEDHEEEGAGDLVDRGRGEVDLAHRRPERPLPHEHGHDEKRDPNKEALVRHRQVQDVRVCHLNNVLYQQLFNAKKNFSSPCAFWRSEVQRRSQESCPGDQACRPGRKTPGERKIDISKDS